MPCLARLRHFSQHVVATPQTLAFSFRAWCCSYLLVDLNVLLPARHTLHLPPAMYLILTAWWSRLLSTPYPFAVCLPRASLFAISPGGGESVCRLHTCRTQPLTHTACIHCMPAHTPWRHCTLVDILLAFAYLATWDLPHPSHTPASVETHILFSPRQVKTRALPRHTFTPSADLPAQLRCAAANTVTVVI